MAEEQQQTQEAARESGSGGSKGGTAVKAAAAAAATGVAAFAAKKALSGRRHSNGQSRNGGSPGKDDSIFASMLAGGWDAARDTLLPAAEDAAGAAGEFLAQNGPEVIRERIVPRFIESFHEASGGN
jgi:hypothetical protein